MTPNEMAERFADDARALRARAEAIGARPGRPVGPGAQASRAMADACEQVAALCAVSGNDAAAVDELRRTLQQRLAAERDPQARHVYAGAVERLRPADAAGGAHDDPDDDDEDDFDAEFDEDDPELDDDDLLDRENGDGAR